MSEFIRLPPLNALRGFEAVARHMSFGRAAEELRVTPAAVSQQIKNLEEFLGVQLFRRQGRRIQLTETGRQVLPGIEKGFGNLADAVRPYLNPVPTGNISCSKLLLSLHVGWYHVCKAGLLSIQISTCAFRHLMNS